MNNECYYPIEKERIITPIKLIVEHDVANLMIAVRENEWEIINTKIIPNLNENENKDLLIIGFLDYPDRGNLDIQKIIDDELLGMGIQDTEELKESFNEMKKGLRPEEELIPKALLFLKKYKKGQENIPVEPKGLRANLKKIFGVELKNNRG